MYQRHFECQTEIAAAPPELFAHLDSHDRLAGHMSKSSWMMLGSRMDVRLDEGRGLRLGSVIRLDGAVLGLKLHVEESVAEHKPPARKAWETIGTPELLVVGAYRMGFDITPAAAGSRLRVFIDYDLPKEGLGLVLGWLLGGFYARWCTRRMLGDAKAHFAPKTIGSSMKLAR